LVLKLLTNHCYPDRKARRESFLYLFGTGMEDSINHVGAQRQVHALRQAENDYVRGRNFTATIIARITTIARTA
jgi:hypothetical protein